MILAPVAVPKLDNGFGQERFVSVAEDVEAEHAQPGDDDVAAGGESEDRPKKFQVERKPAKPDRVSARSGEHRAKSRDA